MLPNKYSSNKKNFNKQHSFESKETMPIWLEKFINIYQLLSIDNLSLLETLYHQNIRFQDPIHEINGFNDLSKYFNQLYQNVLSCQFDITQIFHQDNQAAIYWTMIYSHKQLNNGNPITVEGHSLIIGDDGKVIYHRDYIDLGQMLYEHIPVLGRLITWTKKRMLS